MPSLVSTSALEDDGYAKEESVVEALAASGQGEAARTRLEAFVRRRPFCAEAHNDLGVLAHAAGDLVAARAALDRAVALGPDCARYHRNRALVLLDRGDGAAAVAALAEAVRLAPEDPETARVVSELEAVRREARQQEANRRFWQTCRDTHLAPPAYYVRATEELQRRLHALLHASDRLIDLGCGNGDAALLAAPRCAQVVGYDVSGFLVEQARARALSLGLGNATFETLDLEGALPPMAADFVLCLGVLSCLPDEIAPKVLAHLAHTVRPGGVLVLRETVSAAADRGVAYVTGYRARYRNIGVYLAEVRAAGFALLDETLLMSPQPNLENHLWFFRRAQRPA